MTLRLHRGYALLALGYVAGVYALSEVSPAATEGPPGAAAVALEVLSNLFHIPLFAGLAWCLLMSLSGGQWNRPASRALYLVVGFTGATYAALDEWHQSFIAQRSASVMDFVLDCLGIAGLLVLHRAWHGSRVST